MQNMRWNMRNKPLSRLQSTLRTWSSRSLALLLLCSGLWLLFAWGAKEYVVAGAAIAGVAGFTWYQARVRAGRRQAALDAYADREIARAARSAQLRKNRPMVAAILNKP